jgi:hypothetical protein
MNKNVIVGWLSIVVLVITSAYVPMVRAADRISSATNNTSPSVSNANPNQSPSEVRRVGLVVAYSPGNSITIVDRRSNEFTFELDSPLRIVPRHRAHLLARGAFVTVIAPNDAPGGYHVAEGIVIHPNVPAGFPGATPSPAAPTPVTPTPVTPTPVTPTPTPVVFDPPTVVAIPPEPKPPLCFSQSCVPPLPPTLLPLDTTTGYSFPSDFVDWAMPIRVAAFETITIDPLETFTPVGVVEIGSDQLDPRIYLAEIDLNSTTTEVQGRLVPITTTGTLDVTFRRIPQIPNSERTNSPYEEFQFLEPAPDSFSTIFAGGVCFVATTVDGPIKYCSNPFAADDSDQLSVRNNFSSQYEQLRDLISPVAVQFGLENVIQLGHIISMQEDVQHILDCASQLTQEACGADVVVAPVTAQYFQQRFNDQFGGGDDDDEEDGEDGDNGDNGSSSQPTPITVGVIKVLRPVEVSTGGTIQPGDYRIDYWFDANGVFYAATLTGVMTDNTQVTNQQVPAVPAALINAPNSPGQPPTQISACRIFRRCIFFQSKCG